MVKKPSGFTHPYVKGITTLFKENADPSNSVPMKQYMRNQFEFFGITSVPRRELCKKYFNSVPIPPYSEMETIVKQLWELPWRELQYFAIDFMVKYKKQWSVNDGALLEYLVTNKSWWDTVDFIASHVAGPWFKKYPEKIPALSGKWNRSNNIWLQRMSLLYQLKYKSETDLHLLVQYISSLKESKEFFVQKAIGWVLREYSKTNPSWVKRFLKSTTLQPLSTREALKVMMRKNT